MPKRLSGYLIKIIRTIVMRKNNSPLPFFSAPLALALENINYRIKHENAVSIIATTALMTDLQKQELPQHISVQKRQNIGKRIAVRRTRNFRQTRLIIAHYPESYMNELAVPVLLCVTNGVAKVYVGDYILTCQSGDFILIPAMVPKGDNLSYKAADYSESNCDILYIYPGQLFGDGLELWITRFEGRIISSNAQLGAALLKDPFLASFFTQLCKEIQKSPQGEITFQFIKSLILFLLRELRANRAMLPDIKHLHIPAEHNRDPIKYALTYLESNLDAPLTIEHMARETALSPTNFTQLFKQKTGTSFHRYLTGLRIQFAETLLTETDLKVQDVAERIGLSASRLNRYFHAKHNTSPGEFRRKK